MKIAVECKSPLMQKSLELFLSKYLSSVKQCDILVRDEICLNDDRCFYISNDVQADLIKPFSKSQLILALENRYKNISKDASVGFELKEELEESLNFEILQKRIEYLTQEYQQNILKSVKAFYEK
ncbi:MAG: hypothetical protein L3I99_04975 [Sulfurimonas sp.]|nr:hypothetical protein [Sulfurimonas sp.]